jgi:hypothetical protein
MELYNLKNDLGETTDLAAKHPKQVKALATRLSRQLRQWNASLPVVKSTGKPIPMPDEAFGRIN